MSVSFRNAAGSVVAWATRTRSDGSEVQQAEVITAVPVAADFQTVTVTTTATLLSALCSGAALPTPGGQVATHALYRVPTNAAASVFWVDDNGTPTTTDAFEAAAGEWGEWVNLSQVKLIAASGTVAVRVSFRRY